MHWHSHALRGQQCGVHTVPMVPSAARHVASRSDGQIHGEKNPLKKNPNAKRAGLSWKACVLHAGKYIRKASQLALQSLYTSQSAGEVPTVVQAAWAVPQTRPSPSPHPLCHVPPVHLSVTAHSARQETAPGDSLPLVSLPAEINEEMQLFRLGIWVESK